MIPEHMLRRRRKRRWTAFMVAYWVVLVSAVVYGLETLIFSDHEVATKWMIGIVGGLISGLLVHWGVLHTVALRE